MTDTPRHSVSVTGIVVNEAGEVLVIRRRDNNHWEPPGGVLELSETIESGVAREVHEETGMSVRVERLTGVYKNIQRGIVALVYRCTPLSKPQHSTAEASAVRWMTLDEVGESMTPAYAVRVTDAFTAELNTRTHDGAKLLTDEK